jgi:hypothetical protein
MVKISSLHITKYGVILISDKANKQHLRRWKKMEKHLKAVRVAVAFTGHTGVEVVENGLGGFCTISLENSYVLESNDYIQKLEKYLNTEKYWIEAYNSQEIIVGLE